MPGGLHPPLSVMESWPAPNTVDPESHGPAATIVCAVFGSIAVVIVAMRLWARCIIQRRGGLDDIIVAVALIPLIGINIAVPIGSSVYGEIHHTWDNSLTKLIGERKVAIGAELFYVLASSLIKVSVLLFYRRMGQRTVSPRFLTVIWISIASVIAYSVAFFVVIFVSCRPFHAFWMEIDPLWSATNPYTCYDEGAHLIAATGISLTQDIIATTLPAILCFRLQMPLRQKLALNAVFALGYLAAVIAGIRIYFVWRMFYDTYDATWEAWYCWILAALEINIAATCSSLPAVKVFFRDSVLVAVRSLRHSRSASRSNGSGSVQKRSVQDRDRDHREGGRLSGDTDRYLLKGVSATELKSFALPIGRGGGDDSV
ncbi:integral membrane protein [Aspergillus heteromorphus CBS 117.55]|uniref:Integral membrane protein n=1 Tax=Aspergillus heteromorphus CBS 117.55 TaxID=1448321 RepID=A0A317WIW1_9EURO|nr:uncharacterized protein BO70DRAFT_313420 [Aspergillus heteromorphus CBS 117.55]PWY84998.1 integral membrane protein [Aspergillus heteromorphus CBS 117.55]